jgi:hypothetical protein
MALLYTYMLLIILRRISISFHLICDYVFYKSLSAELKYDKLIVI